MSYNNRRLFSKKQKGFSIGEVIISSFVLTIGLVAVTALIAKSLKNSFGTRDAIIAVELAQEGVELVRNVRDNGFAAGGTGFADFSPNRHCRIDYDDSITSLDCDASLGSPSRYYLQYRDGFYGHFGSTAERFSRSLYIDYNDPGADQENAFVRSFVYWGTFIPPSTGAADNCTIANKCVFTEVQLTNWK